MNSIRKAYFSGSWYPDTSRDVHQQLSKWRNALPPFDKQIVSGIVPHAGWFFSGIFAYDAIRRLEKDTDLLIVLGGHLPENYPILYYRENFCETPCGDLPIDRELVDIIAGALPSEFDNRPDNTVEVQLPIIKALMDDITIVPLRVPAGEASFDLVDLIKSYGSDKNLKIRIISSTDLTHYGPNYDFEPQGSLGDPKGWVENYDRKILKAMTDLRVLDILKEAKNNHSACSAGAAACAALFASNEGVAKGRLLAYETSLSKHKADSFVGYGTVIYEL